MYERHDDARSLWKNKLARNVYGMTFIIPIATLVRSQLRKIELEG